MKLVRNMETTVVHRPDCNSRGADARPWRYATMRTLAMIVADTQENPWLHLCGNCLPGVCRCANRCAAKAAARAESKAVAP